MVKLKIAVISHALVNEVAQKRWQLLAKNRDYEVHLLIPKYWEHTWFGENDKVVFNPKEIHNDNFHVHLLKTTSNKAWGQYFFISADAKFRKIKPNLIYIIHEESVRIHHQIYLYRNIFAPKAKIIFFSMNARGVVIKKFYHKWMWENIIKNTNAALVHYPGCLKSLRSGGYKKPVFLQTQIGVDEMLFKPNKKIRDEYRKKLGFENKFVIGYTGRLSIDKGVDDLMSIFPLKGVDWALLLVGNGNLKEDIEKKVKSNGWENRVHITNYIDQAIVPEYMNAMDTFVLCSKTMPHWIDTFPLVTVQAQACGIPVVASNSASLPWQLDGTAQIFLEGDTKGLNNCIMKYYNNKEYRNSMAENGRERSLKYFCVKSLTENFKKVVDQVMNDKYVYHKDKEKYIQWKAY